MLETEKKYKTRKEKMKAVIEEMMRPENIPAGYTAKRLYARGGIYSKITRLP